MKVILMAAGKGTRISKHIREIPKCLVQVGEKPLIRHTIDMLKEHNINDISVIVGYKHEQIEKELENTGVQTFFNPFYSVTNSLGSLYFAKEKLKDDDIILANADVYMESNSLELLLKDDRNIVLLSDVNGVKNGDYFFATDQQNHIIKYGKDLTEDQRTCEYVGIAKIKKNVLPKVVSQFNKMINNEEYNKWWENICYELNTSMPIYSLDVKNNFWAETDYLEDYLKILKHVQTQQDNEKDL